MIIYIILMLTVLLCGTALNVNYTQKRKRNFLLLFFTIITALAMLRKYTVGIDTKHFCNGYKVISNLNWNSFDNINYEWGFTALCKLLNYISPEPQLLIIVSSLLIFPPVGMFIYKSSEDVVLSTYIFISLNIFSMNMNVMRQSIAVGIILLGLEYLKKNKYLFFIAFVLFASIFHQSAIICLIMIVYYRMNYKKRTLLYTLIACVIGFVGFKYIFKFAVNLFENYAGYIDSEFAVSNYFGTAFNLSICAIILVFGLIYYRTDGIYLLKKELNNQISYDFQAYSISACLFCLVVGLQMTILLRAKLYFTVFYISWLPNAIYMIDFKSIRILYKVLFVSFTMLYFIIIAVYRPEWYGVVPYEFSWQ
ncbi:EpsG family protein [Ruminiclostridium sufflavum]|nr:EpsG family protein [Ruminiclostridium sufflavum]